MNLSEHKDQLKKALTITPHLSKIDPKNHWLYVPECLRVAILESRQALDTATISQITGFDCESLERWFLEDEFVVRLKEKITHYEPHRGINQP